MLITAPAPTRNRVVIPEPAQMPALPPPGWTLRRLSGTAIGTDWTLSAHAPLDIGDAALRGLVEAAFTEVRALFSTWEATSEITRFNRAPTAGWQPVSTAFDAVLRRACEIARLTEGALDPTLGTLNSLWGFGAEGPRPRGAPLPGDDEVEAARAACGWRRLAFAPGGKAMARPSGLRLDLGGVAKGRAVDILSERLTGAGIESHLVEIGGELRGHGVKADGMPWWVRLEPPPGHAAPPVVVALADLALATSGDWRRGFRHGSRFYSHTIDPATGRPVTNGVASVSVLAGDAMQADMLATAFWVMGAPRAMAFAHRYEVAALILTRGPRGYTEHASPAFAAMAECGPEGQWI